MKKSLSILFFLSILSLSQIAFSQNAINYEKSDLFIHVNIPSLAYHPNNAYDCNIIQSYGLGIEYKFKNRLALSFNFTRNIQDFDYNVLNKNITYNSFVYKPSLRYYLDSNSKVYVDLGAVVNSCNDKIMENNVINEEKFVQNAITTGIGYKVYFLKNKRLGMDFFISTKIFIWENGRDDNYFRGTFIYDPFYFNGSVFYRF